jgi:anti-anti-sigma regulatory factor
MDVFHEILADRYVLLLADGPSSPAAPDTLERCLQQAWRSRKPNVWVDCSRLRTLSAVHRELLLHYHQRLQRRGVQLVLNCLTPDLQHIFDHVQPDARPLIISEEAQTTQSAA